VSHRRFVAVKMFILHSSSLHALAVIAHPISMRDSISLSETNEMGLYAL
jgi:hypothetical protein